MTSKGVLCILISILACAMVITEVTAAEEEILIIVNKETEITSINLNTLVDIYTSNRTKWGNGQKIHVSMLKKGPVHEAFSNDLIGMAPKKLSGLWKKVVFTGLGTPPKVVANEAEMIEYVASTKGAIGYVASAAVIPEKVQIVKVN